MSRRKYREEKPFKYCNSYVYGGQSIYEQAAAGNEPKEIGEVMFLFPAAVNRANLNAVYTEPARIIRYPIRAYGLINYKHILDPPLKLLLRDPINRFRLTLRRPAKSEKPPLASFASVAAKVAISVFIRLHVLRTVYVAYVSSGRDGFPCPKGGLHNALALNSAGTGGLKTAARGIMAVYRNQN